MPREIPYLVASTARNANRLQLSGQNDSYIRLNDTYVRLNVPRGTMAGAIVAIAIDDRADTMRCTLKPSETATSDTSELRGFTLRVK